jgi:hypothetical protein
VARKVGRYYFQRLFFKARDTQKLRAVVKQTGLRWLVEERAFATRLSATEGG